jgi:hypothetical protein
MGTHVELASHLRLSMCTLNSDVKNHEGTERKYVQCGPFSKQQKSLKRSPLEKLECALAAWFKLACESNASIDSTHLKEKALHIVTRLGIVNFSASNGWIDRFEGRHLIVYRTLPGESRIIDPETADDWKNNSLLQEIEGYDIYMYVLWRICSDCC